MYWKPYYYVNRSFSAHLVIICYSLFFFTPSSISRPSLDERVKISILPNVLEITDLHIKSALKKSKIFTAFNLLAVEVSSYTIFGRGVNYTQYNLFHQLKTFSNGFWRNFLIFGHQKRVNRLKNHGANTFLQWARWKGVHFFLT